MFSGQIAFDPGTDPHRFSHRVSDRHQLRLLSPNDAENLFALVNANRTYLQQWLAWLNTTKTIEDTQHFIRRTQKRNQDNQGFAAAIIYDNALVGIAGLNGINWRDRHSMIGYWIAEPYQGKGLITVSCKAIISYAFEVLELNRIVIRCASQNLRSQAVPKRLGFVHEGTLREVQWLYNHFVDHEVFSMLRRDWGIG